MKTKKPNDMRNLERACRNNKISCSHKMTLFHAKEGQQNCEKDKDAIGANTPHLREVHLLERHTIAIKKKQFGKARVVEKMMAKERRRRQYGRMRSGVGKPKAQLAA